MVDKPNKMKNDDPPEDGGEGSEEDNREDYSLGGKPASARYNALASIRSTVINSAIELAEVTLPRVFPVENFAEGDQLYVPNQSVNADAVNNWSNVLAYTGFPPGLPMMAYNVLKHKLTEAEQQDPEVFSKLMMALAQLEELHRKRLEATNFRTLYTELLKLLCVTGNVLWKHTTINHPTYHNMHSYVVQRDNLGRPMYCILRERVLLESISDADQEMFTGQAPDESKAAGESDVDDDGDMDDHVYVYTVCQWEYPEIYLNGKDDEVKWYYWQETANGTVLEETKDEGFEEKVPSPMFPAWLTPNLGKNWGYSYCEDYRGDLFQVENDHNALNDGSAIAALMLLLVDPAGMTSAESVRQADNTDVISGRSQDVTAFQTNKSGDMQVVANHVGNAEKRVARAFLQNISIQRQAERVTKEEVVTMRQDIDRASGGLHTQISQTIQKHVLMRFIHLHELEDANVPKMPKEIVQVSVVTGVDSLGRSVDYDNLIQVATDASTVLTPQGLAAAVNQDDFLRRLMAAKSIKPEGLVKTADQQAADQQQAQQQGMQQQIAGPVAGAAAKAGFGAMAQNAVEQSAPK